MWMVSNLFPFLVGALTAGWLGLANWALIAFTADPLEIGSSAERMTLVGMLVSGIVVLVTGIGFLYLQNSKAWKSHHEDTIKRIEQERRERNEERKEEHRVLTDLLRECSSALHHSASVTESLRLSVERLMRDK